MQMKKIIFCTVFFLGLTTRAVLAECTLNPDYNYPLTATIPTTDRVVNTGGSGSNFGGVSLSTVASALGVGTTTILATCTSGETLIAENNEASLLSNAAVYNNYFSTTVPGFGMQFSIGGTGGINIPTGGVTSYTLSSSGSYSLTSVFESVSVRSLYYAWRARTDTPVGGDVAESALAARLITSDGKELVRIYYDSFNVMVGSCALMSWDAEVDVGSIAASALQAPGAYGDETNFNINITCTATSRVPSVTFEGSTDTTYTSVFTNQSGDEFAKGVGVQLLKDGNVITPGESVPLTVAASGNRAYEFSSRIFSLSPSTTEGKIDIPVTFTMTYE